MTRRREFLAFVSAWQMQIRRQDPNETADKLASKIVLFEEQVAKVAWDLEVPPFGEKSFLELAEQVSCLTAKTIREGDGNRTTGWGILHHRLSELQHFVLASPPH